MSNQKRHNYPTWVLAHKQQGTELRFINGRYYLYAVTSRYDSVLKRAKKITGKIIGSITQQDGFIPSGKSALRKQADETNRVDASTIAVREYGFSSFLKAYSTTIEQKLFEHFPDLATIIIYMAYCRLLFHSPLKRMDFHLRRSFLTLDDNTIYSERKFSQAMRLIGANRTAIIAYLQSFMQVNDYVLVDLTNIFTASEHMRFAKEGYNSDMVFATQFNLLYIYSMRLQQPAFYKVYSGNIKDVKGFQLCLEESGVTDAIIIADKGFYSKENIEFLVAANQRFIIPLKRDNTAIDYSLFTKEKMSFFKFQDRYIWYHSYDAAQPNMTIYLFLDEKLQVQETKDYLDRAEKLPEEYSKEGYMERKHKFGTIAMLSNEKEQNPEHIYTSYKSRNTVEVMFDGIKNILAADSTYMQDEEALEGYMFVNHIALQWYYIIYNLLKQNKMLKNYSVTDFIRQLVEIKKVAVNKEWHTEPIIKRTEAMLKKMGIHIT